jgi:hypothetical protein
MVYLGHITMATWDTLLYLDVRLVIALALRLVIIYVCTPMLCGGSHVTTVVPWPFQHMFVK